VEDAPKIKETAMQRVVLQIGEQGTVGLFSAVTCTGQNRPRFTVRPQNNNQQTSNPASRVYNAPAIQQFSKPRLQCARNPAIQQAAFTMRPQSSNSASRVYNAPAIQQFSKPRLQCARNPANKPTECLSR
jgi:hypothetical protein